MTFLIETFTTVRQILRVVSFIGLSTVALFTSLLLLFWMWRVVLPAIVGRVTWVRIYEYPSRTGEAPVGTWFLRQDYWRLKRAGMAGTFGSKRCFLGCNSTLASTRKFLSDETAAEVMRRKEERREAFERRPRWSWKAEHPTFETWHKWTDKLFKLFQWLAVSAALKYVGGKTDSWVINVTGTALSIAAVAPYYWLIKEAFYNRLEITPESSERWTTIYTLVFLLFSFSVLFGIGEYVPRLVEALVQAQLKDAPARPSSDLGASPG